MKKFLICLAPIVLSFSVIIFEMELLFSVALWLVPIGSLLSGYFAAEAVCKESKISDGVTALLAIVTFLVVGVAYLAIAVYGGCSLIGGYFS